MTSTSTAVFEIPPLTAEEEDRIILNRITNDERPLKRIIKKFHTYISLQHGASESALSDARELLLTEINSFQITLRKNAMVCEAEARQVQEYEHERKRIDDEYGTLRGQIEQLKTSLEHAQMERRRKMEYDQVAEKVNTFPTRMEIESEIESLEHDIGLIKAEHELQDRTMRSQKSALDTIVSEISQLRFISKDQDEIASPSGSPSPAILDADSLTREDGEEPVLRYPSSSAPEDDIEMGEVEESSVQHNFSGRGKKKTKDEELEEGEATDSSSELSDPPDE